MTNFKFSLSACLSLSMCALALFTGCGGGSSSGSGGTTTPPPTSNTAPTITSVAPSSVSAGAGDTTLTVTGTGFISTTGIQVGEVVEQTMYMSSTQVKALVPAAQLNSGAKLAVIALNGSSTSAAGPAVDLEVDNPSPTIAQLVPASFVTGAAATQVSVTGTGFVPATSITINGAARPTTFASGTEVSVILSAADLSLAGNLPLVAVNPAPGGGSSAAASVAINNPVPGALTLSPSTVAAGAGHATTVMVGGSGFLSSSVVQVGGTARATTFVSTTELTFQLTVADQGSAGNLSVTVVNPAPGGGSSPAATLTVAAPTSTPVIQSVYPTQFLVGGGDTTIQVAGTGLTSSSVVLWNGSSLATQLINNSGFGPYLSAAVPAKLLAAAGTAMITVNSPTANPSVSNALQVTIANPPAPTLTQLYPSAGATQTDTVVTLSGTNFTASSTVAFNGVNLPVTFKDSATLTVTLPASSVQLPGNGSFTVTTPAPGGGTTSALTYTAYVAIANNSMIYNPANGLLYVSVPGSAGAPYGNSIVTVDPETGALGTPIFVGSEPNRLAISSDGTVLWVGLDGASAVRQVDLKTNTAGLQFSLGGNAGIYANPGTAVALAALPGAPNSVVVSSTNEFSGLQISIFDSGVRRGTSATGPGYTLAQALQVDGSRSEIYAAAGGQYNVYSYSASGLTLKASATSGIYSNYSSDDLQVTGGRVYTDLGGVYDSESGALLGTLYSSGQTAASGPTYADTTLGRVFVLEAGPFVSQNGPTPIQVFNTSDFNQTSASTIPLNLVSGTNYSNVSNPAHLVRWGTNGLAVRTDVGVFSVRSNLVKDLSTVSSDLSVTGAVSGSSATGSNTTFTATVTNAGPADATNVALTALIPTTGVLVAATPSVGSCSVSTTVTCDLGGLAMGASATVAVVVKQLTAGSSAVTFQVSGSETDPSLTNNQATATATITGSAVNLAPVLASINPAAVESGAGDTTITVNGSGFASGSSVLLDGSALATTFVNDTQLSATVPSAKLASLGWSAVTVSSPAPGGGVSAAVPLTVYSVITLGVNHILYDPYSTKIMASIGSGSSAVTGNSIAAITPETATVGKPVPIGSQPTNMALTSDGQILYTVLSGSQSVARFNMLTQQADYTYQIPSNSSFDGGVALRGVATQPGTEDTIAVDLAAYSGNAIFDFDPAHKTAAIRGQASGPYSGSCIHFLDAGDMLSFDVDTSGATLDHFKVTSAGFGYSSYTSSTLNRFGCFQLSGGLAFANAGGVANPATVPATQIGIFNGLTGGPFSTLVDVAPDVSLQRAFFLTSSSSFGSLDVVEAFDPATFLPTGTIPIDFASVEGAVSYSPVDMIRWGQDGLAILTSGGHIYLLRGAAVVPQLLAQNTAAKLTSSSITTIAHGAGNTMLTLTGSNFIPGVAATWNGSYRTTTIVDATHLTVAIPASDFAAAGTGSLVATNPGASASSALTVTVQ